MSLVVLASPSLDFLNSFFWQFMAMIVGIVAFIGFLVYRYYIEPPIARKMTSAKWKGGSPAFIQDDANVVHFVVNDTELPEGVHHNRRGWFLRSRSPYLPMDGAAPMKRGPGRPPKANGEPQSASDISDNVADEALETVLQAPILEGLGKAVFFGYDGAPLLSNLKTLALTNDKQLLDKAYPHADLRVMKEIIPATISRTQLGNLHRWATAKGYEKRGGDVTKLIVLCLIVVAPIVVTGLIVYLLMNKPA